MDLRSTGGWARVPYVTVVLCLVVHLGRGIVVDQDSYDYSPEIAGLVEPDTLSNETSLADDYAQEVPAAAAKPDETDSTGKKLSLGEVGNSHKAGWNSGCNEVSGCKNWMRGVWPQAHYDEMIKEDNYQNYYMSAVHKQSGRSLAGEQEWSSLDDAPPEVASDVKAKMLALSWVHDDSDSPTLAHHGWVAFKLEYEDHVIVLDHSEDNNVLPECNDNGMVQLPTSLLAGRQVRAGDVVLIEQCLKSDGTASEHLGEVTQVRKIKGRHASVVTKSKTRASVASLMARGRMTVILPLGDDVVASNATQAYEKMREAGHLVEMGELQRVVRAAAPEDIKPNDPYEGDITTKIKGDLGTPEEKTALKLGPLHAGAKAMFKQTTTFSGDWSTAIGAATDATPVDDWDTDDDDHKILGVDIGKIGLNIAGNYKILARLGSTFHAQVVVENVANCNKEKCKVSTYEAFVTGDASADITGVAEIKLAGKLKLTILDYLELNLGAFIGCPFLKLAIKPVITFVATGAMSAKVTIKDSWSATNTKLGVKKTGSDPAVVYNVATDVNFDSKTTLEASTALTIALKLSLVFRVGVDVTVASATAGLTATLAAKFMWNKRFCRDEAGSSESMTFELLCGATAEVEAKFVVFKKIKRMTLRKMEPCKFCTTPDHKCKRHLKTPVECSQTKTPWKVNDFVDAQTEGTWKAGIITKVDTTNSEEYKYTVDYLFSDKVEVDIVTNAQTRRVTCLRPEESRVLGRARGMVTYDNQDLKCGTWKRGDCSWAMADALRINRVKASCPECGRCRVPFNTGQWYKSRVEWDTGGVIVKGEKFDESTKGWELPLGEPFRNAGRRGSRTSQTAEDLDVRTIERDADGSWGSLEEEAQAEDKEHFHKLWADDYAIEDEYVHKVFPSNDASSSYGDYYA